MSHLLICFKIEIGLLSRLMTLSDETQETNGSPVNPCGHWQTVKWFLTVHSASTPQNVKQGLMQRRLRQTLSLAQSEFSKQSKIFNDHLDKFKN